MKRRYLVLAVSAITLAVIVVVAAGILGLGVGTSAGREAIRSLVEKQVAGRVNGKIHIGRVTGTMLTGFTIDSFEIRDEKDSVFVSTGPVKLQYDPRDLMDRRLLLRNVEVERPVIRLHQDDNGDWNFHQIFASRGPKTPDVPGRSFGDYVILHDVRVKNGTFILTRAWSPDDSLRGAKRDSAIRTNLASTTREIRRAAGGFTHTYRWTQLSAVLPRIRIADPDSAGQLFVIQSLNVEEKEPPFSFRNTRGTVRKLGDSIFVDATHFDLPASTGSATGKIWWGSSLPVRVDIRVIGDSVSLRDVAWVYPTLPREGGGRTRLRIRNNRDNLNAFDYALTDMDVRSTKSRLTGAMTFTVGNEVLEVRDVDMRASPVNFDLLRTLAGEPFSVDWQGDLYGSVKGRGGPLTHFVVDESDVTWRDTHVAGAVSRFSGRGELDILEPEFTNFHGFDVSVGTLDLRSIQFLFPEFPRLGGVVSGVARLDSSWLDVRFSNADVRHANGPGEPTRVTGRGRVTWSEAFMLYDVDVNAAPVSLDMMSRAYDLGLTGLMSGPVRASGTSDSLIVDARLEGPAGKIAYAGLVDLYPLSVAVRGGGRVDGLDLSRLLAGGKAPAGFLTGAYQLDIRADTNDLGTLQGRASALVERSELGGIRVFPSRVRARFADGRVHLDTLRIESTAARLEASGALGLTQRVADSLRYSVTVDSLGGLRRYIQDFLPKATTSAATADSISGTLSAAGVVRGSLASLDVSGELSGSELFVRREAGRQIKGSFALEGLQGGPRGTATIRVDDLNLGGIRLDTLGAAIRFERPREGVFTFGARGVNGVRLEAGGDLAMAADSSVALVLRDATVTTDSSRWTLRGAAAIRQTATDLSIDSLVLANGRGGRIGLEARVPRVDSAHARMFLRADSVPLFDVGRIVQLDRPLSGIGHLTLQGAGTSAAPVMNMQATLRGVRYGGMTLEGVMANGEYERSRAQVDVNILRGAHTAIVARGSLPVALRYFGMETLEDSLRASIRTDSASFDVIEAFVPGLRDASGRLAANLDIAGTWKHPDVAGGLRVENGEVWVDSLGILLRGVDVDVRLFGHADSLAVNRLSAWSGAGPANSVAVSGYVTYRDLSNPYLRLRLDARQFRAIDRRALGRLDASTEPDGLRLRGQLHGATLTGGIIADRGTLYLPDPELARKQVDFTTALRDSSMFAQAEGPTSKLLESIIIDDVRITLGDEVWLRSSEANIKLGGALNVQRRQKRGLAAALGALESDSTYVPTLDGVLRAERGTYALALGLVQREFQVEGGTITFFGSAELPPELNISALHTVRTVSAGDLRIRVRLTGPLYPNPIVTLESAESFALSQSDLVSYLIFGQPNFELGNEGRSYVQLAAQTLLPSTQTFVASQLRTWVGSAADFLQLRPGTADASQVLDRQSRGEALGDFFWSSRLGGEKQITNNLFVSVSTGLCPLKPGRTEDSSFQDLFLTGLSGKLEYRLSRDASVKAGKEPAADVCRPYVGRVVAVPSQWGLSLFKTWRF